MTKFLVIILSIYFMMELNAIGIEEKFTEETEQCDGCSCSTEKAKVDFRPFYP